MKTTGRRILRWTPRVLGILYIIFLVPFTLDAFSPDNSFWENLIGFLIHLVPLAILALSLVLAWRWELVGAVLFSSFGAFYIIMVWPRFDWLAYLIISGPLFLIGVLFLLSRLSSPSEFPGE